MQTIIMTVGTSLLTNKDSSPIESRRRPWALKEHPRPTANEALAWMSAAEPEEISEETNTLMRLDLQPSDEIILLHSDTEEGQLCADIIVKFFSESMGQESVKRCRLPLIDYESDAQQSALERMALLLFLDLSSPIEVGRFHGRRKGNQKGFSACLRQEQVRGDRPEWR